MPNINLINIILQYVDKSELFKFMQTCSILKKHIVSSNYWYNSEITKSSFSIDYIDYIKACELLNRLKFIKVQILPSYSRAYCRYLINIFYKKSKIPIHNVIHEMEQLNLSDTGAAKHLKNRCSKYIISKHTSFTGL